MCTVSRGRTNTPLQALVLLNDVQFVGGGPCAGSDVSARHTNLQDQIREAFVRLAGRQPDNDELQLLSELCEEQRKLFSEKAGDEVAKFIRLGESKSDATLDPVELAALTVTCQTILNLDAAIYERCEHANVAILDICRFFARNLAFPAGPEDWIFTRPSDLPLRLGWY